MNQNQQTCIILLAKFPIHGYGKNPFCSRHLGMEGAVHMARKLLLHSIEQAVATGFTVERCVTPAPTDLMLANAWFA